MLSRSARPQPFARLCLWRGPGAWSRLGKTWYWRPTLLNDAKVRAAKPQPKPYKLTDSHRLFLLVNPSGSKLWRWNYAFDGKQKSMAFEIYPMVSLVSARAKRDEVRAGP
jgi:hypothetical protein